ncbi:MAG: hypothetical protein ACR2RL_25545 [Gammaproteobacteria bacterium]
MSRQARYTAKFLILLMPFIGFSASSDEAYFEAHFERYNSARRALPIPESMALKIEDGAQLAVDAKVDEIARKIVEEYLTRDRLPPFDECLEYESCRSAQLAMFKTWALKSHTVTRVSERTGSVTLSYRGVDGRDIEGTGYVTFIKEDGQWKIQTESFSPNVVEKDAAIQPAP